MNSFEAVTRGYASKPYRWDRPLPEVGAQVIVERPGGGEEAAVTGHQPRQVADAPQALALATPDRLELLEDSSLKPAFDLHASERGRWPAQVRTLHDQQRPKDPLYYASDNTEDVRDRCETSPLSSALRSSWCSWRREAARPAGRARSMRSAELPLTFSRCPQPYDQNGEGPDLLTPQKLSGRCGKLKRRLAYEADTHREYLEEVALRKYTVRSPKATPRSST